MAIKVGDKFRWADKSGRSVVPRLFGAIFIIEAIRERVVKFSYPGKEWPGLDSRAHGVLEFGLERGDIERISKPLSNKELYDRMLKDEI